MRIINKHAIFFLLITLMFSSCVDCIKGEGELISEERTLKEFEIIVIKGNTDVIIHQNKLSNSCEAIITAQKNLIPYVKTTVDGSKLTIEVDGCIEATKQMEVEIAFNDISKIIMEGSGDLISSNILKCNGLKIQHNSSGDLELRIKGLELDVELKGSGDIQLSGNMDELELDLSGSGDFSAKELSTLNAEVKNEGSGSITINVKDNLGMILRGSGDISYYGNPTITNRKDEGSGDIKTMN